MLKYILVSLTVNLVLSCLFVGLLNLIGFLDRADFQECFSIMFIIMTIRSGFDYYFNKKRRIGTKPILLYLITYANLFCSCEQETPILIQKIRLLYFMLLQTMIYITLL